jgi:hypothetical protein
VIVSRRVYKCEVSLFAGVKTKARRSIVRDLTGERDQTGNFD